MKDGSQNEAPLEKIYEVPLKDIEISTKNVRRNPDSAKKDLDELAASIKRHGLLQPVVLIGEYGNPPYELISGQRRYLAHERLRRRNIRAVFAAKKLNRPETIIRSLVENLQRVELEYADTARAVTYLYKQFDNDDRKVQEATGLSLRKIREFIEIEERATPKMKRMMEQGVKPTDVKRAIRAAQDDLKKAEELLELMAKEKLTNDQKGRIVSYGRSNRNASASTIYKEAVKPQITQKIIVTLSENIREGLNRATKSYEMDPADLAAQVLSDWLEAQGFI